MTFGNEWGWGSEEEVARAVFDRYIDAGGNFIDTADLYTGGHSEELVGSSPASSVCVIAWCWRQSLPST